MIYAIAINDDEAALLDIRKAAGTDEMAAFSVRLPEKSGNNAGLEAADRTCALYAVKRVLAMADGRFDLSTTRLTPLCATS